jgi:tetratricopeptide (TPR) repeat protein
MLRGEDMTKGRRVDMGLSLRGFLVAAFLSTSSVAAAGADPKTGADPKIAFPPCTTTVTEADRKAAQGAFAAGQGSFNEADYQTAITYWRDAYRRDCSAHALLLNLARAYELKGDRGEAVNALETYLQRKPDVAEADQIRRRIENLKSQMAAEKPAAPAPPPPVAPVPAPTAAAVTPTTAAPPVAPTSTDAAETSQGRSPMPLIVAGGGGVLGVVGAVVLVGGISKVQEAEKTCPTHKCADDVPGASEAIELGNAGRQQQVIGGVLLGAGVAAVGGGLLWYFLSSPSNDTSPKAAFSLRRATTTPAVGPGYAGISLGGSF